MNNDKRSEWQAMIDDLTEIVDSVGDGLVASGHGAQVAQIREYICVNEYGLAWEDICNLLEEAAHPISPRTYALIAATGRRMHLRPGGWEARRSPTGRSAASWAGSWGTPPSKGPRCCWAGAIASASRRRWPRGRWAACWVAWAAGGRRATVLLRPRRQRRTALRFSPV